MTLQPSPRPHSAVRPRGLRSGFLRPEGAFPNVFDLAVIFAIFLVANLMAAAAVMLAGGEPLPPAAGAVPPACSAAQAAVYCATMGMTVAGTLRYRRLRRGAVLPLRLSAGALSLPVLMWGAGLMLAAGTVAEPLLTLLPRHEIRFGCDLWALLSVVVAAPLFEEWLCRGIVLESLRETCGTFAAWIVSSLFFALLHLDPLYAANAFVMGLVLAFVYLRTRSLWSSVALHALNNASAFWLAATGRDDLTARDWTGGGWSYALFYAAALAIVLGSVRGIRRTVADRENRPAA